MKRIIFAGFLFITFVFFYAFGEKSHLSFGAQQESSLEKNKYDSPHTTFNASTASWAKTYGGTGHERCAEYLPIQETSDGGYIFLGTTKSFGPGGEDIWILKLNSSGGIEWQRTYGASHLDRGWSVQQTSDGGYIVGGATKSFGAGNSDIWILKLDSSGGIEWQRTYGGTDWDGSPYIQEAAGGGYIIAAGTDSFGAGGSDSWILKLDSSGDIEWQRTYGGSLGDGSRCVQLTSDGGYIIAGWTVSFGAGGGDSWILKLDSSGDIEWQQTYGGILDDEAKDIKPTSDGGYIVAGITREYGRYGNFLILKLTSSGDIEWQRAYGGTFMDYPWTIQQTVDGGYIVAGITREYGRYGNFLILKLTSSGDIEWQRAYGGTFMDYPWSIQQTSDGGYIVAGYTESFDQQNRWLDASVIKLSSSGDIEWQEAYGGDVDELAWSIQQTSDGGYIVAGLSYPLAGGSGDPYGAGGDDLLILKIDPNGDIPDCGLQGSPNNSVNELSWSPLDTGITPINTNVVPQNTNIQPQESDAIVNNVCPGPHTLTLSASTGGTTDPQPGVYTYDGGIYVTLQANPDIGYEFTGWTGLALRDNPITIAMDSDKSITANFSTITNIGDGSDGSPRRKGGCFIATAAYGSPLHSHVKALRDFRDKYLMPTKPGRTLVYLYYKYSPFVADLIAKQKALKAAVRFNLMPLVVFSYSTVHFGPIISTVLLVFIIVLPILLILFWQRRMRRVEARLS